MSFRKIALLLPVLATFMTINIYPDIQRGKWGFLPIAAPFYTPDTSWGGGGFLLAYREVATEDGRKTDQLGLFSALTMKGQKSIGIVSDFILTEDYRLQGGLAYRNSKEEFWGTGPDTRESDLEKFTMEEFLLEAALLRKITPSLYVGPQARFRYSDIIDTEENSVLAQDTLTGSRGGIETGAGAKLVYDTTDSTFYPLKGFLVDLSTLYTGISSASDFSYTSFRGDFRHYRGITGKHVLAFQGVVELCTEDVPFQSMSTIGGSIIMRGFQENRFTDINSAAFQGEYRFPLFSFLAGVVFVSAGTVGETVTDLLSVESYHPAAGAGLRFIIDKKEHIAVRVDFGYSEEGLNIYFLFREAF